jgi:hypothetical protein
MGRCSDKIAQTCRLTSGLCRSIKVQFSPIHLLNGSAGNLSDSQKKNLCSSTPPSPVFRPGKLAEQTFEQLTL